MIIYIYKKIKIDSYSENILIDTFYNISNDDFLKLKDIIDELNKINIYTEYILIIK